MDNQEPNIERPINKISSQVAPSTNKKAIMALILVLVVVIASVVGFYSFHSSNKRTINTAGSSEAPATVSITDTGFNPSTISIKPGQTVVWTNADSAPHEVAADPYPLDNGIPGFNSTVVLLYKDSLSFTFDNLGTYHYHDQLNPLKFKGMVEVE